MELDQTRFNRTARRRIRASGTIRRSRFRAQSAASPPTSSRTQKAAVRDEILGTFTQTFSDFKAAIKTDIEDGVKSLVTDDVKKADDDNKASQPAPLVRFGSYEAKITAIVQQQIAAAKSAGA